MNSLDFLIGLCAAGLVCSFVVLGYQIGYTNDIENGMSGGPVIDSQGHLVGINGRLKHPFNGIYSYRFPDNSMPSQEQFLQMQSLSWAIPITNYKQINN